MYYTKYRPQKFSEISRPNEAADVLSNEVKSGKTVHAYLFMGSRGTGKTTTARIVAKALNCKNLQENGDPCGKCEFCKAIKDGSFVDLIEIDAASNRSIDDIRDLRDKIKLAPVMGTKKIYIIDEVHMLTTEAFNALLKTLEEPPRNVVFILCTTEIHKVPETIKSRCQVFIFKRATVTQIVKKLKEIAHQEKIKINDQELQRIAKASLGGFRDAETLLQQVAEGELNVESLLGMSSKEVFIEFLDLLVTGEAGKAIGVVGKAYEEGIDIYVWLGEFLKYLREILLVKSEDKSVLDDETKEIVIEMERQAEKVSFYLLNQIIFKFLEAHKNIKQSFIPQLPIELAISEICNGQGDKQTQNNREPLTPIKTNNSTLSNKEETVKKETVGKKEKPEEIEVVIPTVKENSKEEVDIPSDKNIIELTEVEGKWQEVIKKSKELNHSITALLKSGKPVAIDGRFINFEVFFKFHKERLEAPNNRKLVENLLQEIFGVAVKIKCSVSKEKPKNLKKGETGELTDYNVEIPSNSQINSGSLLDILDGGLPLAH